MTQTDQSPEAASAPEHDSLNAEQVGYKQTLNSRHVQLTGAVNVAKALSSAYLPISAVMTRTVSAAGMDWGLLAAAGALTIIPGALVIWFVRNYIARGFALGRV